MTTNHLDYPLALQERFPTKINVHQRLAQHGDRQVPPRQHPLLFALVTMHILGHIWSRGSQRRGQATDLLMGAFGLTYLSTRGELTVAGHLGNHTPKPPKAAHDLMGVVRLPSPKASSSSCCWLRCKGTASGTVDPHLNQARSFCRSIICLGFRPRLPASSNISLALSQVSCSSTLAPAFVRPN